MTNAALGISFIILIINCSSQISHRLSSYNDKSSQSVINADSSGISKYHDSDQLKMTLPDSLFKYKDLKNTAFIRKAAIESFTELDSIQKRILILPYIKFFRDRLDYWDTRFISKQEKIGDLQPIIIYILSTDYLAIWYMVLNKDLQPISKLIIGSHGDYQNEYIAETDSTITYDSIKYCDLQKNKIILHSISATMRRNKTNYSLGDPTKLSQIDSTNLFYDIRPNGSFYLSKKDNFKYQRFFNHRETQEYWRVHF